MRPTSSTHRSRLRWWLGTAAALVLVAEVPICRWTLGLGDPPLAMRDSEIEYLLVPSQTYHRFGNTIAVNAVSMRSPELPKHKKSTEELRVLLVGDSIVYGGHNLDQSETIGARLRELVAEPTGRPVAVGAAAASSWGPANQYAYLRRYGLFDADYLVLVLGPGDLYDHPTFQSTGPNPSTAPLMALMELPGIALKRFMPSPEPVHEGPQTMTLPDVKAIVDLARSAGADVMIVLQPLAHRVHAGAPSPALQQFGATAQQWDVPVLKLLDVYSATEVHAPALYEDHIHPSAAGASLIAAEIAGWIVGRTKAQVMAPKTSP